MKRETRIRNKRENEHTNKDAQISIKKVGEEKWYLIGGVLMALFHVGVYRPLLIGYTGAVVLYHKNRWLYIFLQLLLLGFVMPMEQVCKYGIAMLITLCFVLLFEWMDNRCLIWTVAVTAGVSLGIVSMFGELLVSTPKSYLVSILLESMITALVLPMFAKVLYYIPLLYEKKLDSQREKRKQEHAVPKMNNGGVIEKLRLMNYADSFLDLSGMLQQMSQAKKEFTSEEMGRMHNEVTGAVCAGCMAYENCWNEARPMIREAIAAYLLALRDNRTIKEAEKAAIHQSCVYGNELMQEAGKVFERAKLNLAWHNRLVENRGIIADQINAMADIMEDMATHVTDVTADYPKELAKLEYLAKEQGLILEHFCVQELQSGRLRLQMEASTKSGHSMTAKALTTIVNQAFQMELMLQKDNKTMIGKLSAPYVYEEAYTYECTYGVARLTKDGVAVNGDNFSYFENQGGNAYAILSDGMGFGVSACKESELVLELLEKFLTAGFSPVTSLRMLNGAMVLCDETESYSTADLCHIDLYEGNCLFYKIGAAPTFIKREGQVHTVYSDSLPVGVSGDLQIVTDKVQLFDGEYVILVSDGVMEHLHVECAEDTICEMIETISAINPTEMAKRILDRVMLFTGGKVPDDMTVLVVGLWER